jgi:hypothetical protein
VRTNTNDPGLHATGLDETRGREDFVAGFGRDALEVELQLGLVIEKRVGDSWMLPELLRRSVRAGGGGFDGQTDSASETAGPSHAERVGLRNMCTFGSLR